MSFGGERCSYDAHRLYMWLALDGGFGWPGDSWCQGTCQRSTPKAFPLSCMPTSVACPALTIGYACSCSNGPALTGTIYQDFKGDLLNSLCMGKYSIFGNVVVGDRAA
jgi:hypothetical protein